MGEQDCVVSQRMCKPREFGHFEEGNIMPFALKDGSSGAPSGTATNDKDVAFSRLQGAKLEWCSKAAE